MRRPRAFLENGVCPRNKKGRKKAKSMIANVEQRKESCPENVVS